MLCHATTHPIRYWTYQITQIQTQVHQIHLFWTHLNHQTPGILKDDDTQKINVKVKIVSMTLLKSAQILYISYLKLHTIRRSQISNGMRIHYSTRFISYNSQMPLIFLSQLKKTYMLIINYPYIRGEDFKDYAKNDTWNILNAYIDTNIQRLTY